MNRFKILGQSLLMTAAVLSIPFVTSTAVAAVVVNGVSYDYAGVVTSVTGSTMQIGNKRFSLGISGNVRKGKSVVPLSTVQPGTYVGVKIQPNARGGLPLVVELTVLPQ